MKLSKMFNRYLSQTSHSRTANSQESLIHIFEQFIKFIGYDIKASKVGRENIRGYIKFLESRNYSHSTFLKYYNRAKYAFQWAFMEQIIPTNPFLLIHKYEIAHISRKETIKKPAITEDEKNRLIAKALAMPRRYWIFEFIITVAWETGLRISDIHKLRWKAIDDENWIIDIIPQKTKRFNKQLQIPIGPGLKAWIERRLAGPQWHGDQSFKDCVCPEAAMRNTRYIAEMFAEICKECGIKNSIHGFRRACVTRLLDKMVPITTISEITGQSPKTVMTYARPTLEEKKRAIGLIA